MPNIDADDDDNEIAFFTFHLFSIIFMCHIPLLQKYVLLYIFAFLKMHFSINTNIFSVSNRLDDWTYGLFKGLIHHMYVKP